MKIKIKQIISASWGGTYTLVGLGVDGKVYTYIHPEHGWKQLSMELLFVEEHRED